MKTPFYRQILTSDSIYFEKKEQFNTTCALLIQFKGVCSSLDCEKCPGGRWYDEKSRGCRISGFRDNGYSYEDETVVKNAREWLQDNFSKSSKNIDEIIFKNPNVPNYFMSFVDENNKFGNVLMRIDRGTVYPGTLKSIKTKIEKITIIRTLPFFSIRNWMGLQKNPLI